MRVKVLITGATGFLGSRVVRVLAARGHSLHVVHRASSHTESVIPYAARVLTADVTDPVAMTAAASGMDAIVHLAADLSHARRHRHRIFRTNVSGTRNVAEAAKTAAVPLLVHVSSIAAVGFSIDGRPIDEQAPNNFVPLKLVYHESKRLAEEEAFDARRYGVRVICLNPGVLYGPRELRHGFGHTMLELARGAVPGHPTGGLSIVDVDDVAEAFGEALERGVDGERYLLAGENVTYEEAFRAQATAIGASYRGRPLPSRFLYAAAVAMEARAALTRTEPRLTRDNAVIAPLQMWYTSAKAERELNFRRRPLQQTFERMARAYRAAGLLPVADA